MSAVTDEFTEVISSWSEDLICEHEETCYQRVVWHVTFHSCGVFLLCDAHLRRFAGDAAAALDRCGLVGCAACHQSFPTFEAICQVRPV